jgi:hypothetical protein
LVAAALRRAWDRVRVPGPEGTPWRFAAAASFPFLVVLSLAATARDIYSAPALLGFGVLVALWIREAQRSPTRWDSVAICSTRWLVVVLSCVFAAFPAIFAISGAQPIYLLASGVVLVNTVISTRLSARAQTNGDLQASFRWTYIAYVAAVCVMGIAVFPAIDRWQDLPRLARQIQADCVHNELALLSPDETTIAMLDYKLRTPFTILATREDDPGVTTKTREQVVADWFDTHGTSARILVLLPGHASGDVTRLLEHFRPGKPPDDGAADALKSHGIAAVERLYELPQGRRYALLAPPDKR